MIYFIKITVLFFIIVDDQITWLHNSSDPWNLVEKYWVITRQKRLKNVLDTNTKDLFTISDYMKKFPALKKPAGYNLVSYILIYYTYNKY